MAGTPVTAAQLVATIKRFYSNARMEQVIFGNRHRWLLNNFKDRKTGGEHDPNVVWFEDSQGISADFATAQANANQPQVEQFQVTPPAAGLHNVFQLDTDLMLRSMDDSSAFIKQQTYRFAQTIRGLSNFVEKTLLGDGYGSLGTVANSTLTTTEMTLNNTDDARLFEVGMKLVFAASKTAALRDSGATLTVTKVSFATGVVTLSANLSTISGLAQNDHVFREGTAYNNASFKLPLGLSAWLPASDPGSGDSFYGVDRSDHPTRLAGIRTTGAKSDIYAAVNDAASLALDYGHADGEMVALTSNRNIGRLAAQANVSARTVPGRRGAQGFQSVPIWTPAGEINTFGSPWVGSQDDTLYLLDTSTWELIYLGAKPVYVWDLDGSMVQRLPGSSGIEIRAESRPAIKCSNPGRNVRVTLS